MRLRPYQDRIIKDVRAGWNEFRRQLVVCPTGGGKTIVFAHMAEEYLPSRTLILAHREELVSQAIDKIYAATEIRAGREKAESRACLSDPVVVASVQTMIRRLDRWPAGHFGLVVADEAHHAISESWQTVLRHFDSGGARVLGVTATPDRGDKRDLGKYFENIASEVGLFELVDAGYLSRITVKSVPLAIDLSGVRSVAGDFSDADLGSVLDPYLDRIAGAIRDNAGFRRVLAFLPLRVTSQKFVEACRGAGLSAEHIDGESPDRAEILERFRRWEFDVLSNAMLLTEGYDDPGIDCIVTLRPTRSRPLYAQMVGRGTRVHEHKENLLLLDFLWLHEKHSVVRPAHLVAATQEEADVITKLAQERQAGASQDELDLQGLASETQAKREEALRKKLEANRKKGAKVLSAEEFALEHNRMDLLEFEPVMQWEFESITEKQAMALRYAKVDLSTVKGKGHASRLLDLHFASRKLVAASPAQKATMRRLGHPGWETATAEDARKFFGRLRARAGKGVAA